ncbi:hypothetical protein, partial [Komagataeibacter kakiaceti]|uniref:hypothetical protein n=1 Tax=Komagataeibacter kakiaceti TaxID=943261 RepID=UPI0005576238
PPRRRDGPERGRWRAQAFIVMEMDERIATTVTQPRLAHVLARHKAPGAGFRFFRLAAAPPG